MDDPRYRCDGCGNVTRFDVTTSQTTKAFHHYTVGGELEVEDSTLLAHHVDEVLCRWCGHGRNVVEIDGTLTDAVESGAGHEREESGAPPRVP